MRLMILGDTHGDIEWCRKVTKIAGRHGATTILQVGDYGYWPRMTTTQSGRPHAHALFEAITDACHRTGVTDWVFLDGNHDDHESLGKAIDNPADDDGMIRMGEHVRYSPRGNRFVWAGRHIGTLGGAVSLDAWLETIGVEFGGRPYRAGWDWFPDLEAPSAANVDCLADGPPLDLLLTHDAPIQVDMSAHFGFRGIAIPDEIQQRARFVRHLIGQAADMTCAELLVHGHWHCRKSSTLEYPNHNCRVEALASNSRRGGRDGRAYLFVDLPDMIVTDGRKALNLKPTSEDEP